MNDHALHALRIDAVEQLTLNPTASHRWHALVDIFNTAPTPAARAELSAAVRARISPDGVAGFFRATFLADLTREPAQLTTAARLLHTIAPYDADRLMAFLYHQWGVAVRDDTSHSDFRARMLLADVPALTARAGRHLAATLSGSPLAARAAPTTLRKVALVVPFIGAATHPPTEMALQQAALLRSLGLEVKLFSCQEMLQPHMAHYLGSKSMLSVTAPVINALAARLPPGTSASLGDRRLSLMGRWTEMHALVRQFDPDLVLFVGLASPLMQPLYEALPVLGLNVHAVSPIAPVDVWLTADAARAGRTSSEWGDALPPAFGHYHPFRSKTAAPAAPLTREQLGLAPGQLALITVGARLKHEIAGAWAQRMCDILARHPQLVWMLAGGPGELPPALAGVNPDQLRLLAHRTDLRSVLARCDMYVNPPRLGGGLSAAEAMAEGLPVLALADGDAGSKLGGMAVLDEQAYFELLEALLASPDLRAQTGAAAQQRYRLVLDLAGSGPSLMQACELALERFRAR